MAKLINEIGNKYGFLTIIEKVPSPREGDTRAYYRCKCDCGAEKTVSSYALRSGQTVSCGCKKRLQHHAHDLSLIGKRFGSLVIKAPGKYVNNKYYWICQCDCGREIETSQSNLQGGRSSQCIECSKKNRAITKAAKYIKSGDVFGRLTVMEKIPSPNQGDTKAYYKCQCECGNTTIVCGALLRKGITKSCGCLRKELLTDDSIVGEKHYMLTVLGIDRIENGKKYVKCKCDCGKEKIVRFDEITRKDISEATISCGCLKRSFGEKKIESVLNSLNIYYNREETFSDLLNEENNARLRFDFSVKSKNNEKIYFLIEYDGIQHYKEIDYFRSSLKNVKSHDNLKNNYCDQNNIPLLRISYKDFNNIETIITNYIKINFPFLLK